MRTLLRAQVLSFTLVATTRRCACQGRVLSLSPFRALSDSPVRPQKYEDDAKSVDQREKEFTQMRIQSGLYEWRNDPQHVLVVHPKIRWGSESVTGEEAQLKLEEACTLVKTLPGFSIANTMMIGTDYNTKKKLIWGPGRLESLSEEQTRCGATAIMINVDILSPMQQAALAEQLRVPVYDRYTFVLRIFKFFARTKEAYLQISLAEIPYIRKADKFEILRLREHSLRKKIRAAMDEKANDVEMKKLNAQKKARQALLVAVIGYTNSGKTTLIKALTGASHISGENRLFATLDTTVHPATLPSRNLLFFADTIGFISDLPIGLIASFEATLRHVKNADVLIHIQDLSHPNLRAQRENVEKTLNDLKMDADLVENMINVGNKVDRLSQKEIERFKEQDEGLVLVSCRTNRGLPVLVDVLDKKPGSPLAAYLYAEGFVYEEPDTDNDGNLVFNVQMTDEQLSRLQAYLKGSGRRIARTASA